MTVAGLEISAEHQTRSNVKTTMSNAESLYTDSVDQHVLSC